MQRTVEAPAPTIENYRLEGLIGSGALGDVHRAVDLRHRRAVALKLLRAGPASAEAARRFAAETAAARRLGHPGIVRVFETGTAIGRPWLAMELLAGCDLQRYTRQARLLPEAVVARVGQRIAEALAYAHAQGVVHRDVKPSNVIVDWASDRLTLLTEEARAIAELTKGAVAADLDKALAMASAGEAAAGAKERAVTRARAKLRLASRAVN